jgi:hypothetical protein
MACTVSYVRAELSSGMIDRCHICLGLPWVAFRRYRRGTVGFETYVSVLLDRFIFLEFVYDNYIKT